MWNTKFRFSVGGFVRCFVVCTLLVGSSLGWRPFWMLVISALVESETDYLRQWCFCCQPKWTQFSEKNEFQLQQSGQTTYLCYIRFENWLFKCLCAGVTKDPVWLQCRWILSVWKWLQTIFGCPSIKNPLVLVSLAVFFCSFASTI